MSEGATRSVVAGSKGGKTATEEVSTEWQQAIQSGVREGGQDMNLSDCDMCESLNIFVFLFFCSRGRELAQELEL